MDPANSSAVSENSLPDSTTSAPVPQVLAQSYEPSQARFPRLLIFIPMLLCALSLLGIAYLFAQNQSIQAQLRSEQINRSVETPLPKENKTIEDMETPDETGPKVYKITITPAFAPGETPGSITRLLETDFSIPLLRFKNQGAIFYDTQETDPYRNTRPTFPFYIATAEPLTASNYSSPSGEASVEKQPSKLLPFLLDEKYCQVDSDCVIRADFCQVGAFNSFHEFGDGPWGCGPADYEQVPNAFTQEEVERARLQCSTFAEVKYEGVACEQQRCVAKNPYWACRAETE